MFIFLTIILVFFFAPSTNAQVPTPAISATSAGTSQSNQAPAVTQTANAPSQPTSPPTQSQHEVVLGRSYQDIQDNYRKIQEQRKLAQEQQIQAAKAQAAAKAAATTKAPVAKNTSPATSQATTAMSPQEYYWQQQLERQQLKAGIQAPESVSSLEKRTYAGLTKTQIKPATKKSVSRQAATQAPLSGSAVQEEVSLARKKASNLQKKRKKKIGKAGRQHAKKQKISAKASSTSKAQEEATQAKLSVQ